MQAGRGVNNEVHYFWSDLTDKEQGHGARDGLDTVKTKSGKDL